MRALLLVGVLAALVLAGLGLQAVRRASDRAQAPLVPTRAPTLTRVQLPVAAATTPASPTATVTPPATPTATPTETPLPAATQTALFLAEPCANYDQVPADLLVHVDRETGLARDYEPPDLATVALAAGNELYRSIPLRRSVHRPLLDLLAAMNAAELKPLVMSGYRSFSEQTLAFEKWQQLYPDRAPEISAQPGHSEHQLGTAVDFSTAEMVELRPWPADFVPSGAILRVEDAVERAVWIPLIAGEPLADAKLGAKGAGRGIAALIPTGMRAVTIQTPNVSTGVAGFVLPGNKVDVPCVEGIPCGS